MKAGTTQQDAAEAINLAAKEIKEEVDTVTTTTTTTEPVAPIKPKKTRAKKVAPTPAPSPEPILETTEILSEDMPKEEKVPKAKKPRVKKEPSAPKEKKRAPSAYNLFVKEIMPELKKENAENGKNQRDLMKIAAERWNEHKAKNAA